MVEHKLNTLMWAIYNGTFIIFRKKERKSLSFMEIIIELWILSPIFFNNTLWKAELLTYNYNFGCDLGAKVCTPNP